jgi:hypothetical protein
MEIIFSMLASVAVTLSVCMILALAVYKAYVRSGPMMKLECQTIKPEETKQHTEKV